MSAWSTASFSTIGSLGGSSIVGASIGDIGANWRSKTEAHRLEAEEAANPRDTAETPAEWCACPRFTCI